MKISCIINTASLDPWVVGGNMWRSAGYKKRAELLRQKVLPSVLKQGFDEAIVCGVFEEGEGYEYVHSTSKFRDRRDALWQRELGARYSTGDVLVFMHDDHALGEEFIVRLKDWILNEYEVEPMARPVVGPWDLLIPKRIHGITGAELNNGKAGDYMGGHALVMKRWLWARVPWIATNTEWWDKSMTRIWREAGAKLVWADDLIHIDVEATETET